MQLSFTQPTADIFYSSFSFIFLDEASTLTFSAAKLVQATFLQVPGALFSEFFSKTFPSAAHSKKLFLPKGEIIRQFLASYVFLANSDSTVKNKCFTSKNIEL